MLTRGAGWAGRGGSLACSCPGVWDGLSGERCLDGCLKAECCGFVVAALSSMRSGSCCLDSRVQMTHLKSLSLQENAGTGSIH